MLLPLIWVGCAAVIIPAAVRSRHHREALRTGRIAVGVLYIAAGAAVNVFFLARGDDYTEFANGAYIPFVRDTWRDVVAPHHEAWIGLLVAFELTVGVLALLGGRRTQLAYGAAIAFHIALLSFGWGFYLRSVPMIAALATLLRVERRTAPTVTATQLPKAQAPGSGRLTMNPAAEHTGVDLYWIPLGAGHHSVRVNGIVYEALRASIERRGRCDLYHSALCIDLRGARYWVEMTPVPDTNGKQRGVVAEGPVGLAYLGRSRPFRYEVRRWRDGIVPDLAYAVASPVRITDDRDMTRRIFDLLPLVPTLVWGRDEEGTGDMWTCNSVISWTLATAGVDIRAVPMPEHGRAPGWDAGNVVADRHRPHMQHASALAS